jgi:hypothetical protein
MNNNYLSYYVLEMSQRVAELDEILNEVILEIKLRNKVKIPIHFIITKDMIDNKEIAVIPKWLGINDKNYQTALEAVEDILYVKYLFVGPVLYATIVYWLENNMADFKHLKILSDTEDDLDVVLKIPSNGKIKYKQMQRQT